MRRKKLPPDKRLDWRDPNMPCLCMGRYNKNEEFRLIEVRPDIRSQVSRNAMNTAGEPDWRNDPTYNMKTKK